MRRELLPLLRCPVCDGKPLRPAADDDAEQMEAGQLSCPNGHHVELRRGVLRSLTMPDAQLREQLSEGARERRGDLTPEEKDAYRRNYSTIGSRTYNELIRQNAAPLLDAFTSAPGTSLDLGGGSGWLAAELARRGFLAVSLDIEDPFERAAQIERGAPSRNFELVIDQIGAEDVGQVNFVVGDMDNLPFSDESFDVVTISAALHHSADPVRTLREAARVLRRGGSVLCLNEPVKGLFRHPAPLHGRSEAAGEHMYSAGVYLRFFREAGLKANLFFPAWVDQRLRQREWTGVIYYSRLRPLVARLWRLDFVRRVVTGPLLRPAMDLFGLTLIVRAVKPFAKSVG